MSENIVINAETRTGLGKGAVGRLRRAEKIPAVFYGPDTKSLPLTVDYRELKNALFSDAGTPSVFSLAIKTDSGIEEKTVTLKDHQVDRIKKKIIHADFYEVDLTKKLTVEVPLVLLGKPAGVELGGMLQQIRRNLTVEALPHSLPEKIEVDVSAMNIGDSLHVSELPVPEGVTIPYDVDFTLATLMALKGQKTEEEEEEVEGEEEQV